jgi:hypothetical protein
MLRCAVKQFPCKKKKYPQEGAHSLSELKIFKFHRSSIAHFKLPFFFWLELIMSEDLRVPTFIPYETEAPASGKTVTKRKRTAKKENKPNKKKKAVKATKRCKNI